MNTVYMDSDANDDVRRQRLYARTVVRDFAAADHHRIMRVCKKHDPGGVRLSGSARGAVSHAGRAICRDRNPTETEVHPPSGDEKGFCANWWQTAVAT